MSVRLDDRLGHSLLSRSVAALSTAAPFAVPAARPGARVTRLLSGGPADEALPTADLAQALAEVMTGTRSSSALQYGDSPGLPRLRSVLADREGVSPDRVVITNGALHGVWLTLGAVVERGDIVAIDDPVFPDTPRIIEAAGGIVHPIPVDRDGIDVSAIESLVRTGTRLKAVYTVADFHNPTGHTLSAARRAQLVALAERYGFLVLSDNPYRQHRLRGAQVPDFPADCDHVVRVNTFSKSLGPGLRLGWVIAPQWLAPHLVNIRRRADFHSSTLTQHVVADLLSRPGWFDQLGHEARGIYARRARTLTSSLYSHVPDLLRFDEPDGGFFVWAEVTDPAISADALAAAAASAGLVFAPGSWFAPTTRSIAHRHVRLAYSAANLDALADVGPRLAQIAAGLRATVPGGQP